SSTTPRLDAAHRRYRTRDHGQRADGRSPVPVPDEGSFANRGVLSGNPEYRSWATLLVLGSSLEEVFEPGEVVAVGPPRRGGHHRCGDGGEPGGLAAVAQGHQ